MSTTNTAVRYYPFPFWFIFLLIKWFGTALAGWSYWWVLMPIVPLVFLLIEKAGL